MDYEHDSSHIRATILLVEDEQELSLEIKQLLECIGSGGVRMLPDRKT
jgi:hypothetical protein